MRRSDVFRLPGMVVAPGREKTVMWTSQSHAVCDVKDGHDCCEERFQLCWFRTTAGRGKEGGSARGGAGGMWCFTRCWVNQSSLFFLVLWTWNLCQKRQFLVFTYVVYKGMLVRTRLMPIYLEEQNESIRVGSAYMLLQFAPSLRLQCGLLQSVPSGL